MPYLDSPIESIVYQLINNLQRWLVFNWLRVCVSMLEWPIWRWQRKEAFKKVGWPFSWLCSVCRWLAKGLWLFGNHVCIDRSEQVYINELTRQRVHCTGGLQKACNLIERLCLNWPIRRQYIISWLGSVYRWLTKAYGWLEGNVWID
jgi:hypothetical protein